MAVPEQGNRHIQRLESEKIANLRKKADVFRWTLGRGATERGLEAHSLYLFANIVRERIPDGDDTLNRCHFLPFAVSGALPRYSHVLRLCRKSLACIIVTLRGTRIRFPPPPLGPICEPIARWPFSFAGAEFLDLLCYMPLSCGQ